MTDITKQLADALREGLSACNSVHMGLDRRVVRDGCALYLQTEEWCKWLEEEVSPKLREALATYEAQAEEPKQEPVARIDSPVRLERDGLYRAEVTLTRALPQFSDLYPVAQTEPRKPLTEAEIERGREATFSTSNPFCPCDSKTMQKAVRWAERAHGIKENP